MNILITGASSGIGRSTAMELLHKEGVHVTALSRNKERLDALLREAEEEDLSTRLHCFVGDINDDEFLLRVYGETEEKGRGVQVIINNAGELINKPFSLLNRDDWEAVYRTNVFSVAAVIKVFLPMLKNNSTMEASVFISHILNIGSMGGVQGSLKFAGLSAYSSSKGALSILTECLAEELGQQGISVNCLALGSVQTEMFANAFPGMEASMKPGKIGQYLAEFALTGHRFYNGKVLPVTFSTP